MRKNRIFRQALSAILNGLDLAKAETRISVLSRKYKFNPMHGAQDLDPFIKESFPLKNNRVKDGAFFADNIRFRPGEYDEEVNSWIRGYYLLVSADDIPLCVFPFGIPFPKLELAVNGVDWNPKGILMIEQA